MEKLLYHIDSQDLNPRQQLNLKQYALGAQNIQLTVNILGTSQRRYKKKEIKQNLQKSVLKDYLINNVSAFSTANVLSRLKKQQIVKTFIQKLKRNIVRKVNISQQSNNLTLTRSNQQQTQNIFQGEEVMFQNSCLNNTFYLVRFFSVLFLFLLTSIYISFEDAHVLYPELSILKIISIILLVVQFSKISYDIFSKDKKEQKMKLIKTQLQLRAKSLIFLFMLLFSIALDKEIIIELVLVFIYFIQVINQIGKLKSMENYIMIESVYQKYWDLCKIILINFFIAHCLSIVLNAMAKIESQGDNWYDLKNLNGKQWFQKYIWGYYWGTTIMLTVGFGDLSANNYLQALCLIFIETVSCIILAYNISQVSKIIQNMRQLDNQKNHKLKVFHTISRKYELPQELSDNVRNHIQQSIQMKKDYNIAQQEKIIQELPDKLLKDIKKQINKSIFNSVYFFGDLTLKCQQKLAEKIHKIVTHPDQLILKKGQPWKVLILRTGTIGLVYRRDKSILNGMIIDKTQIQNKDDHKLISTSFIWGGHIQGDLKSLTVSVLATIQKDMLEQLLKKHNQYMFQYYCGERDRFQNRVQSRTQKCQVCKASKHSKIHCPSMHFCPLKQIIVAKYIKSLGKDGLRMDKQSRRQTFQRKKYYNQLYCTLKNYSQMIQNNELSSLSDNVTLTLSNNNTIPNDASNQNNQKKSKKINRSSFAVPSNSFCVASKSIKKLVNGKKSHVSNITEINNYSQISRKIQKCQYTVDQILSHMKQGEQHGSQIQTDKSSNYKGYFLKHNPENLNTLYPGIQEKINSKLWKKKSRMMRTFTNNQGLKMTLNSNKQ